MSEPVLKVARPGYKVFDAAQKDLTLDSSLLIPKIYKTFRATSSGNTAHGLSYPPQFLTVREITTDPKVYAHATDGGWSVTGVSNKSYADSTNIYISKMGSDVGMWCIVELDPCENPSEDPLPTKTPYPRVIIGGTTDYNRDLDTRYDTLKVYKSGTLSLSIPTITKASGQSDTRSTYFEHNLNYIPFYAPFIPYTSWVDQFYFVNEGLEEIPSTVSLNDLEAIEIPKTIAGYEYPYKEEAYVWVDDTKLNLSYVRTNYDMDSYEFPARTVTLSYTVFYNRVDEAFNILTD
jgi:hypothetical protein